MSQTVSLVLTAQTRDALRRIVDDRRRPLAHILRARIVLLSDERLPVLEVARQSGVGRPTVWRWQQRFAEEGLDGLLRDKTRPPGKSATPQDEVQAVLELTTVQRIWRSHHLQPHRVRTFKRSTDPHFAAKLDDVVGLYMAPPRHTIVLSVDEKSQIQALDRTQPGLPLKPGQCATYTHDYVRNGTTTLFAALNTLEGTVFGRCAPRHRHQEFIAFLDQIEDAVPAGKVIHAVMDNYATHKHPEVVAWLAANPRWTFHFTPTSCSWLNAVEGFFSKLTRQALRRGVFRSVEDLIATIERYIASTNDDPKPFVWTASAASIIAKLKLNQPNDSEH